MLQKALEILSIILASQEVVIACVIVIIGIALRGLLALSKTGRTDFNFRLTGISLIVGFLVSLQLVMTAMEHLPVDAPATVYVTIFIGEILTVMGVDAGTKYVGRKLINPVKPEGQT